MPNLNRYLVRGLLSVKTGIVETGAQFYCIRRYIRPARKVVKEKKNRQNAKKIGRCHAVPTGLNPMLHRSTCHCTYPRRSRDQSQGDIRIPPNRTPYKASRRVSLSLTHTMCPCLDMFVMLMMIQTLLGHLGILPGHVLNNR